MKLPLQYLRKRLANTLLLSTFCLLSACADETANGWVLPDGIAEVSGLAIDAAGQIYLHDDEIGRVYRFDAVTGQVTTVASLGSPALRGDFEGIALLNDDIWLITSKGELHLLKQARTLADAVIDSVAFKTGLKKTCEVEGLDDFKGKLVIACKENYKKADKDAILLFEFDPATGQTSPFLTLSLASLGRKNFSPSALVVTEDKIYLLGAKQHRLVVVDHDGQLLTDFKLAKQVHPQAEGLAIHQGQIYIADEGHGRGGKITSYAGLTGISSK